MAPGGTASWQRDRGIRSAMTGWGCGNDFAWHSKYIWELGYQSGQWNRRPTRKS